MLRISNFTCRLACRCEYNESNANTVVFLGKFWFIQKVDRIVQAETIVHRFLLKLPSKSGTAYNFSMYFQLCGLGYMSSFFFFFKEKQFNNILFNKVVFLSLTFAHRIFLATM